MTDNTKSSKIPSSTAKPNAVQGIMKQSSIPNRYIFEFNGLKIYEWDQNLDEVNIYIDAPSGRKASDFDIIIQANNLKVGMKGHDRYFIDEKTFGKVDTSESSWYLDESILHIILIKVSRGSVWEQVLMGRGYDKEEGSSDITKRSLIDPLTKEKMTQELMLERFGEENPGFDFRDAQFNGAVPDPRTFMGGVKYV